jgi:hypothetical protein
VPPCEHKNEKIRLQPLETGAYGGAITYSSSRVRRTLLWRLSPLPQHPQTPPRHVPVPSWRASVLPRTPGGGCFRARHGRLLLCRLCGSWRRGWGHPPLGGSPPPITFFFLLLRRVLWGHRGREPLLLAQPVFLTLLFPALPPPDPPLLLARSPFLLPSLCNVRGRSGSGHRRVRPRGIHNHPLLKGDCQNRAGTLRGSKKGRKTYSPPGRRRA